MSVMGFAFVVGILIWWAERRDIASTRKPVPCHACWCAGDMEIVHWDGHRWVHANGGDRITRLDASVEKLQIACLPILYPAKHYPFGPPVDAIQRVRAKPHPALPRHAEDEISTPTFTPFEERGLDQ